MLQPPGLLPESLPILEGLQSVLWQLIKADLQVKSIKFPVQTWCFLECRHCDALSSRRHLKLRRDLKLHVNPVQNKHGMNAIHSDGSLPLAKAVRSVPCFPAYHKADGRAPLGDNQVLNL